MNYKIEFHPAVSKDYDDAYEWYEQQKVGLRRIYKIFK